MKKNNCDMVLSDQQLEKELQRTMQKRHRRAIFGRTLGILFVITALFGLIIALWFPIYHVTEGTLGTFAEQGQIIVAFRTNALNAGDAAILNSDNQILIKRVIGIPGDWVFLDEQGEVSVAAEFPEERYMEESVLQSTDITYPYQVPGDSYLVMDDETHAASCIDKEQIVGKSVLCIWPLRQAGFIE